MKGKKKYLLLFISLFIIILDQTTKHLVRMNIEYGGVVRVWGNFLRFIHRMNPNAVFGINVGGPTVSLILTLIAFVFVCYLFYKSHETLFLVSLSLIIGGAVGNLIDRFIFHAVTDFIDVGLGGYRFATFNVADSSVTIGIILSIISFILESRAPSSDNP
ncbi:signal peptidase II [candidate division WOR-3 bacterium]|nr:signal peptidase II [candidate division WOR-3 bacterium]